MPTANPFEKNEYPVDVKSLRAADTWLFNSETWAKHQKANDDNVSSQTKNVPKSIARTQKVQVNNILSTVNEPYKISKQTHQAKLKISDLTKVKEVFNKILFQLELQFDNLVRFFDFEEEDIINFFNKIFKHFKPKPEKLPSSPNKKDLTVEAPIKLEQTLYPELPAPITNLPAVVESKPIASYKTSVIPKDNLPALSTMQLLLPKDIYRSIRRLEIGVVLVLIVLIGQSVLIINQGFKFELPGSTSKAQQLEVVSTLPTNSSPGNRVITDFNTNLGIADVGSSLKIQKESISLRNASNCATATIPPDQNGCGFSILPSGLGIPSRGVLYRNIQFEGNFGSGNKLKLDLKDYDKGVLGSEIGTITDFSKKIILPENISNTSGIFIRFWLKDSNQNVNITKILIEYADVSNLRPVSGKVSSDLVGSSINVYQDRDENKLLDPNVDKLWICQPNFSGVAAATVNENGNFILLRDESCFIDVKPDGWYTDEKSSVLPPGKWLLALKDKTLIYSFEIKADDQKVILDFTKKQ